MYCSGEARWFLRGEADAAARSWITTGEYAAEQDERTDLYLVLPGCDSAGIKVREGRFEVKARTGPEKQVDWTPAISGTCDTWIKWSRPDLNVDSLTNEPGSDERWVSVRKRRCVRMFSLESGLPVEIPVDGPWLSAGCMVESSTVTVSDDVWWSFCCESFGAPGALLDQLNAMIGHLAEEAPHLQLPAEASMSYPAWLLSVAS